MKRFFLPVLALLLVLRSAAGANNPAHRNHRHGTCSHRRTNRYL